MPFIARIFIIIIALIFISYVFSKVKKKVFTEKDSFLWMVFSVFIVILSIFPELLNSISIMIGITYPPSLLFTLGILFILGIIFKFEQLLAQLKEKNKELVQSVAILEERIENLEQNSNLENSDEEK